MSNKSIGSAFEIEFAKALSESGFWVHRLTQSSAGQPFDILAVRGDKALAIDCKVCTNNVFDLERVEFNQHVAMSLWEKCGNGNGWFALKLADWSVYLVSFFDIKCLLERGKKRMTIIDIERYGVPLHEWVKYVWT